MKEITVLGLLLVLSINSIAQVKESKVTNRVSAKEVKIVPPKIKPVAKVKVTPPSTILVHIENINQSLCPNSLNRGDREFGGHGPEIKCEVKLRIDKDGTGLWADITFSAIETQHDWSETRGKWSKRVYDAPYGKKITGIISDKASRTKFISPPAGFQFLVPGADVANAINTFFDNEPITASVFAAHGLSQNRKKEFTRLITGKMSNGNTVVRVPALEGTLVKFFHIVGDTGGDDISTDTNCNDDTRIEKIEFFPVKLKMANSN